FGGGGVPPQGVASALARLGGACGRFAVVGNHDYIYGAGGVADALREHGITLLDDEHRGGEFEGYSVDVVRYPRSPWLQGPVQRATGQPLARAADHCAGA